jgi:glycosidase
MQWDATANAGFSTGSPWLPAPPSYRERNVAAQEAAPDSLLNFYRRLIALRRRSPALLDGSYAGLGEDPHVYAYTRTALRHHVIVALNMSAERRTFRLPSPMRTGPFVYRLALSSLPRTEPRGISGEMTLAPFEAVILESRGL